MRPDEARLFWKYAKLDPSQAVKWISEHIGPYDAGRAVAHGRTMADVLRSRGERQPKTSPGWDGISNLDVEEWTVLGCDAAEAREWNRLGCTAGRARDWMSNGFVTASDAGSWASIGVDPADAKRWHDAHASPDEACEWFAVGQDLSAGFVPSPSAGEALEWRRAGLGPRQFATWWNTGLEPSQVADAVGLGRLPTGVDELDPDRRERMIVWSIVHDALQLGMVNDFEYIRASLLTTDAALGCTTWEQLRDEFGPYELELEWGSLLDDVWDERSSRPDADLRLPGRPDGWLPDRSPPDLTGNWLASRSRFTDPELLSLPDFIMREARGRGSPMSGDFVWWDIAQLPILAALARAHRYAFVQRQDLVDS